MLKWENKLFSKPISEQNQFQQKIKNCAERFDISQDTIYELKWLSDGTGIESMDSDTNKAVIMMKQMITIQMI